jgi:hypothetical protein
MATTQLSNLIEPKVFTAYARQQTTVKSAFIASGVLANTADMDARASEGGAVFEAPHFNPFAYTEANVASDDPSQKSVPANVNAGSQIGRKDYRTKDWSAMALASVVSGADAMGYIAGLVSTYWVQDYQALVLAKLKGIELDNAANDGGDMIVNIANDLTGAPTAAQSANIGSILDAHQTMGDAMDKLGVIVMHSQIFTNLMKLEPTAFQAPSATKPFVTYYEKRVVIDDGVPVTQGTNRKTFTTYILGQGAFAYGEANTENATEVWRDPSAGNGSGEERLYSRKHGLIIHPLGFSCNAAVTAPAKSPTLAQYGVATAFDRKFDRKNIAIAILKTNA